MNAVICDIISPLDSLMYNSGVKTFNLNFKSVKKKKTEKRRKCKIKLEKIRKKSPSQSVTVTQALLPPV